MPPPPPRPSPNRQRLLSYEFFARNAGRKRGKVYVCVRVCVCVFPDFNTQGTPDVLARVEMGRDEIFYLNLCIKQRLL